MVELRLLGTLELTASDGRDLSSVARQPKRAALLAYLTAAVPHGLHRRDTLLALFWPELAASNARAALSQALYVLRNALGEHAVLTRGDDEVGIARDVVWCDVHAFEAALDAGNLETALALYRGELLNGFFLSDAPEFEHWVDRERERLRGRAAEGAWAWAEARAAVGDTAQAMRWARWATALAPADEAVMRRLMTFLQRLGDRAAALRAYEVFAAKLTEEFELEPSSETRDLAAAIRAQQPPALVQQPVRGTTSVAGEVPPARRTWRPPLVGLLLGAALMTMLGIRAVRSRAAADPPAPTPLHLAVLPLENLTGDSAQGYFVDGMHEAIIDELAKIQSLGVISRTSVLQFRGAPRSSLPDVAKQLGVTVVLEGSVFRAGDSVRVAIQLIDGRTDQHLWSQVYVRDLHDVLRLYGELASDVAGQVRAAVTPAERGRLESARQVDPDVYVLTLRGGASCLLGAEGKRRGIQLLRMAVARDPTYALAFALLGGCYYDMSINEFIPDSEAEPLARAATRRSLELDSTLGEAYVNRGWGRYVYDQDVAGSSQDFARAVALSPGSVRIRWWYGDYLTLNGRFDEAISQRRQAIALDPLSDQMGAALAWTYLQSRRYDEAIAQAKQTLDMAPGSYIAERQLAWSYSLNGMHAAAVAVCDSAIADAPLPTRRLIREDCGWIYVKAGRGERVRELLRRDPAYCSPDVYASLGDLDRAVACLRNERRRNPQSLAFRNYSPLLDPLRADPRTHAVLMELGIKP